MSVEDPFKTTVKTGPKLETKGPEKMAPGSLLDELRARLIADDKASHLQNLDSLEITPEAVQALTPADIEVIAEYAYLEPDMSEKDSAKRSVAYSAASARLKKEANRVISAASDRYFDDNPD